MCVLYIQCPLLTLKHQQKQQTRRVHKLQRSSSMSSSHYRLRSTPVYNLEMDLPRRQEHSEGYLSIRILSGSITADIDLDRGIKNIHLP